MDTPRIKEAPSRHISAVLSTWTPVIGLILITVVFQFLTSGKLLSYDNLQNISNQVIVTALVAIGAVFVYGIGSFDMSLGSGVLLGSVLGGMVAISTGSIWLSFAVCMAVPLALGWLKGIFASRVEVPFFIFTIVLASIISAIVLVILGDNVTMYLKDAVNQIPEFSFGQMSVINVVVLLLYLGICVLLFNYTGLGTKIKILGGNVFTAKQSGFNINKVKIVSFIISAIGIGLASFLLLIRVRTVGSTTAGSLGTDVLVALVLGGMPISGGPKSKISAGIVGAATITVLNSGLTIVGLSPGIIQAVRGVVFVAVVFIASISYRTKLLPR